MSSNLTWAAWMRGAVLLGVFGLVSAWADDVPQASPAVSAENGGNPYSVIMAGNAFRLSPPPPAVVAQPPPPDLPTVIFAGTVTIGSETKAMFAVKTKEPKTGKGASPEETEYISLKENETKGPVQLLRITPGGEEVEIMNSGTKVVLNMKDNGFEKMIPNAPAGVPGLRGVPGGPIMPVGMPGQPGAQAAVMGGGINVGGDAPAGGGGREIMTGGGGGIMTANRGAAGGGISLGGQGGAFSSANNQANIAAVANTFQQPTYGNPALVNTGGIKLGGSVAPPPSPTVPPISLNAPGSLGSQSSMQPNSTPPTPPGPIMPPLPR